jgi:hypothetical protein
VGLAGGFLTIVALHGDGYEGIARSHVLPQVDIELVRSLMELPTQTAAVASCDSAFVDSRVVRSTRFLVKALREDWRGLDSFRVVVLRMLDS